MNIKRILLVVLMAIAGSTGFSQNEKLSFSSAIDYNDYLVDRINEVDQAYVEALEVGGSKEQCFAKIDSLNKISTRNLKQLKLLIAFNGEKNFVKSTTAFITYMNKISKKNLYDFEKLVFSDNLTAGMSKKMMSIATKLDADYDKYFSKIEVAQKAFAEKSGFSIGN